jgi:iron complex outermembrane receptor protein
LDFPFAHAQFHARVRANKKEKSVSFTFQPHHALFLCSSLLLTTVAQAAEPDAPAPETPPVTTETIAVAPAAPDAQPVPTDAVVITATRFAATIDAAPVNVSVIDAQDIRDSNATNLGEALEFLGNVHVRDMFGVGGTASGVDLSGFGATGSLNTLVLLNGRRLNEIDLSGVNLNAIPLNSIARIEIIRGSASVLYGDNAAGGIINVVTKTGFDAPAASIGVQAGSFSTRRLDASARAVADQHALYVAGSSTVSDGYRDHNASRSANLVSEYTWQSDATTAGVRINLNRDNPELPGVLNEPVFESDPQSAGATKGELTETQRSVEAFVSGTSYAAELAHRAKKLTGNSSSAFGEYDTEADLRTLSFTPRLRGNAAGHDWIAGIDTYRSTLDSAAAYDATDPLYDSDHTGDITHNSYAMYASDTYSLFERISLNLGARYQQVKLDTRSDDRLYATTLKDDSVEHATAWDATLNFRFAPDATGYLRHARSFRFPVLDEIWSYFSGAIAPLKPQRGKHAEGGLIAPLNADTRIELQVFHITLDDEIAYRNDVFANVNLDPTQHDGFNFSLQAQPLPQWRLRFDLAYRDATFRSGADDGKQIPEIPKHKYNLSNSFDVTPEHRIVLDALYTGRRYFGDDFANDGKRMPDYTWLNLGYHYTQPAWKAMVVVKNLTNVSTADLGIYRGANANPYYYFPLPERSVSAGFEATF